MVDLRYYLNGFVFVIVIMGVAPHDQRARDFCYVNNHHYRSADCCTVPVPAMITYTRRHLLDMRTSAACRLLPSNVYEQLRHHKLLRRRRGCRGGRQKRASVSSRNIPVLVSRRITSSRQPFHNQRDSAVNYVDGESLRYSAIDPMSTNLTKYEENHTQLYAV